MCITKRSFYGAMVFKLWWCLIWHREGIPPRTTKLLSAMLQSTRVATAKNGASFFDVTYKVWTVRFERFKNHIFCEQIRLALLYAST